MIRPASTPTPFNENRRPFTGMRFSAVRLLFGLAAVVFLITGSAGPLAADPSSLRRMPSLVDSVRFDAPIRFCGERVPLERPDVRERLEKEMLLGLWNRPQVWLWIKRTGRYMPLIGNMLRDAGLPDDLKYMAVIESALRPHARSHKGAVGFWQFIRSTGKKYGLQIDRFRDERRSVFASTRAAIEYLEALHGMFGSWAMAAAAYNMGEDALAAEIDAQETSDYYRLYLPFETQRYVFKAVVAKLILSDPGAYGFEAEPADLYPPLTFDALNVSCRQDIPLLLVAKAAGTSFKRIKDLNPDIRGHFIPAGDHRILAPKGSRQQFQESFNRMLNAWLQENGQLVYVVRKGDNLTMIAEKFSVPLGSLLIWNRLSRHRHIHPGDRLVIYPPSQSNTASTTD